MRFLKRKLDEAMHKVTLAGVPADEVTAFITEFSALKYSHGQGYAMNWAYNRARELKDLYGRTAEVSSEVRIDGEHGDLPPGDGVPPHTR